MSVHTALSSFDTFLGGSSAPAQGKSGMSRRGFFFGGATAAAAAYAGLHSSAASHMTFAAPDAAIPAAAEVQQPVIPAMPQVFLPRSAADIRNWEQFRNRFIQPDGRVVDSGNGGISHTESQGLGMLFAVSFNDRDTFDRIWNWTRTHLSRGSDALHAWRYVPGTPMPVSDTNNASDGDIYIAGALCRASALWQSTEYLAASGAITRDLLALAVRNVGGRTVLLPGVFGFIKADGVEVNLSYYIFPLLTELAAAFPSPLLSKVIDDGRQMVAEAAFGKRRLPPDWLLVSARDGSLTVAPEHLPRFSFDAVRVPLFLSWAGATPAELRPFTAFWGSRPEYATAWVDLETDATAPYRVSNGVASIAMVADRDGRALPGIAGTDDYYSSALNVLARLAAQETDLHVASDTAPNRPMTSQTVAYKSVSSQRVTAGLRRS